MSEQCRREVWVEPLVRNDIGYSGRAYLVENRGERCDVVCLDDPMAGMLLSVPSDGVLAYLDGGASA